MILGKDAALDLDQADPSLADEVAGRRGGGGLRSCYACGACAASCPVLPHAADFDPRRIIRMLLLGLRDQVLSEPFIWFCASCYSCHEVCPQGVSFAEISFALKNMAVEAGHFPKSLRGQVDLLLGHGRLYEITEFENEKRTKAGLSPVVERPQDYQAILGRLADELRRLGEGHEAEES